MDEDFDDMGIPPGIKDYDELISEDYFEIYVHHCNDSEEEIRDKLALEWREVALSNPEYEQDKLNQNESDQITLVYIEGFFLDDTDLVYYVKGNSNISRFLSGVYMTPAYYGPCFATPCSAHHPKDILEADGVFPLQKLERIQKRGFQNKRWRYLYETGRAIYERLDYDWSKIQNVREKMEQIRHEVREQDKAEAEAEEQGLEDVNERSGDQVVRADKEIEGQEDMEEDEECEENKENVRPPGPKRAAW